MEYPECQAHIKALRIYTDSRIGNEDSRILCLSGNVSAAHSANQPIMGLNGIDKDALAEGCFLLHYEARQNLGLTCHKYRVSLDGIELHCYPYIVGLLIAFADKVFDYGKPESVDEFLYPAMDGRIPSHFEFTRFGFSNFFESDTPEWASIPLACFPFVTISNCGSLASFDSFFINGNPEWRKVFNLRDTKVKAPRSSLKKGFEVLEDQSMRFTSGTDATDQSCNGILLSIIDVVISGSRIQFHDSSCIVGSITLPNANVSLSTTEDCLDMLCSTEGLVLSSPWWTQNVHDFLWGPSLPNLSPILNVRVRKGNFGSLKSLFEISFGVQHVSCTLPPEILERLIDYFSLPDWTSNSVMDSECSNVIYKFEILGSTLYTPHQSEDSLFLKLNIPQCYCSYNHNSDQNIVLKDIPPQCLVPVHKLADRNHCLNVFGRDLSLSLGLLKDNALDSFNQHPGNRIIPLIASVSVDGWIRIPCENVSSFVNPHASVCIMASINSCQLNIEGVYAFVGFEALFNAIEQLSTLQRDSKDHTSDVLHNENLESKGVSTPKTSELTFIEIRCCANSISINLFSSGEESTLEPIAKADMQLVCSASLKNDKLQCLNISFSSLGIFSPCNSVMLAECSSVCPDSPVLDLYLSFSDKVGHELNISTSTCNIWLHLLEWNELINWFSFHSEQLSRTSTVNASVNNSTLDPVDNVKSFTKIDSSNMVTVKTENIGVTFHIPLWARSGAISSFEGPQVLEGSTHIHTHANVGGSHYLFAVTLHTRCSELILNGKNVRFKCNLEKANGVVEICDNKIVQTLPIFQLFQFTLESQTCLENIEHIHVYSEIQCEGLDLWVSHHIIFLQFMCFEIPETNPSKFAFGDIEFKFQMRKASVLFSDGKWSSNGPLLEILLRNMHLHYNNTEDKMEGSLASNLEVNYNNIHKVLWEPFVEPWKFQVGVSREVEKSALLNSSIMTDVQLMSTTELNLNLTESLIEVIYRTIEMINDTCGLMGSNFLSEHPTFLDSQIPENVYARRYAPYILQNLTSLPLVFYTCRSPISLDDLNIAALEDGKLLQPGSSVPIYIDETPEEQLFRHRPARSSDRLNDKQSIGAGHHYIVFQFEGTSIPSAPISMDLVGVSYVEVDFSKSSNQLGIENTGEAIRSSKSIEGNNKVEANSGFIAPVVIDVSVQRYTKLVQLYSTVIILNATSLPFEVRFDIPFGVSPKILDPVYPGQQFPLPLHLAGAGRMRWRPLGNTYLWSEAYNISNILPYDSRIKNLRSFVCYPSHPSSDPFRCCISVQDMYLPSISQLMRDSAFYPSDTVKLSVVGQGQLSHNLDKSNKHSIHIITLSSPLIVKNYLPEAVSMTIESGGISRTMLLTEVETSFFHIDSSHDLTIAFHLHGFKATILKYPRAESFSAMATFSGTKFSVPETITFYSDLCDGPMHVTVEKVMDAFSGAREICLFVPFLLYNCAGFPIVVSSSINEIKGRGCTVPACYDLDEQDPYLGKQEGLSLVSTDQDLGISSHSGSFVNSSLKNRLVSTRKVLDSYPSSLMSRASNHSESARTFHGHSDKPCLDGYKSLLNSMERMSNSSDQCSLNSPIVEEIDHKKVKACMFSPNPECSAGEIMVKVRRYTSYDIAENLTRLSWSSPFLLVSPTGSTSVLIPQPSTNAAYVISVTSSAIAGPFSGKTRIISFQPRYVISNACSKDLRYKQKGTNSAFHLGIGRHSHLHWTDTTKELLVSIRFDEPGWHWSGSFLPENLGDTQVKMRNYASGSVKMIRVEVQNADVSLKDEKIVGSPHGNSGTILILLSEDDTGFMPYRIDNFSKERLRIYQQKCETSETIIHSYTSSPYAWDEPYYPHRLAVEVPGERVIGSYILDEVKEHFPVHLSATVEKPERTLIVSVHAEGATKVLNIVDSSCHISGDLKGLYFPQSKERREHDQEQKTIVDYKIRMSVSLPFIGISLMNSFPQELLFACANNTKINVVQTLDQQKISFQISSLQIDNQLDNAPYPVILSFGSGDKIKPVVKMIIKNEIMKTRNESEVNITSDSSCDPVLSLCAAKWRNKEASLVSFEYISLRVADFCLELEQEVILSCFDFLKAVSSRSQSQKLPHVDSTLHLFSELSFIKESSAFAQARDFVQANKDQLHSGKVPMVIENFHSPLPLDIIPIGAPWQQIYLLARRQKKIYVELFDIAPIKLSLSFSSTPWMLRNGILTSGESVIHRGLMALADIEGAQIHFRQLKISHQLGSWESIQEILLRHYTRQLLHEMYKVFGSAGVIGNPMGFARSVGLGIKDFLSVPARGVLQSPAGLITGMARGTTSLLSNTIYAISDATTQFSRAAHKGIVAFTFDDQTVAKMEKQQKGVSSHSKGVINEVLEGLTGLLQSPIKGAEKHGLPGVLSGIALGVTGLVARPAASILEVTGRTAQSIRNRSKLHQGGFQRLRVRLPRPLSKELPLRPYSWDEAVGVSVLADADDGLKLNETLVLCKALKQGGKYVIITERLILVVSCSSLVDLDKPTFRGVPADPEWVIEAEIGMESIIHADIDEEVVHIVGTNSSVLKTQNQHRQKRSNLMKGKQWDNSRNPLPLFQSNMEFRCKDEAEDALQVLLSAIDLGKERGWSSGHLLQQCNLK